MKKTGKGFMTETTVVILAGGLGNQIFQLASAIDQSRPSKMIVAYGLTDCDLNSSGAPVISDFQIDGLDLEVFRFKRGLISGKLVNLILRLKSGKYGIPLMTDKNFVHNILILVLKISVVSSAYRSPKFSQTNLSRIQLLKSRIQVGYYQRNPINPHTVEILRNGFKLRSTPDWLTELKRLSVVERPLVIHIRLGDYMKQGDFGSLTAEYFKSAIQVLREKQTFGKIWLFSDEVPHAIKYFNEEELANVRIMSDEFHDASSELEAMRFGTGYVISNSSFSWWGARLSHIPEAPVCAPRPWFQGLSTFAGIYAPNWHKIETQK